MPLSIRRMAGPGEVIQPYAQTGAFSAKMKSHISYVHAAARHAIVLVSRNGGMMYVRAALRLGKPLLLAWSR